VCAAGAGSAGLLFAGSSSTTTKFLIEGESMATTYDQATGSAGRSLKSKTMWAIVAAIVVVITLAIAAARRDSSSGTMTGSQSGFNSSQEDRVMGGATGAATMSGAGTATGVDAAASERAATADENNQRELMKSERANENPANEAAPQSPTE
jgi:hypothetical protein